MEASHVLENQDREQLGISSQQMLPAAEVWVALRYGFGGEIVAVRLLSSLDTSAAQRLSHLVGTLCNMNGLTFGLEEIYRCNGFAVATKL